MLNSSILNADHHFLGGAIGFIIAGSPCYKFFRGRVSNIYFLLYFCIWDRFSGGSLGFSHEINFEYFCQWIMVLSISVVLLII